MSGTGKGYLLIVLFMFALSIAAPLLPLHDPNRIDLNSLREPPGLMHPLGTDQRAGIFYPG